MIDELTAFEIKNKATKHLIGKNLNDEFNRMWQPPKNKLTGHPVHYLIQTDNKDDRREIARLLLSGLSLGKRINNRRYSFTNYEIDGNRYR